MTCSYLSFFFTLITALVVLFLFSRSPKRDYRWLYILISIILILGTVVHSQVMYKIPENMTPPEASDLSLYSVIVISFISSVQMFLGSTRIFDNGFQDFLFTEKGVPYLNWLTFLFVLSVCVSLFAIFNIVFQRVFSKWNLRLNKPLKPEEEVHIFFGETKYSRILTREIAGNNTIIVIEYPKDNDAEEVSFLKALTNLSKRTEKKANNDNDNGNRIPRLFSAKRNNKRSILYLKAKRKLSDVELSDKSIADILDLKGIDEYIFRSNTFLYFLSDIEKENITSINNIRLRVDQICAGKDENKMICHIFCHAKKEGYNLSREDDYRNHFDIRFIDSSFLAIRQIICEDPESLPVHFVEINKEGWGQNTAEKVETSEAYNLGYVTSDFNAAIFGFGELGHDAFDFLFEYGAFVNETYTRSKFHVYAYDKDNDNDLRAFKKIYPGLYKDAEEFIDIDNNADLTKDTFWTSFKNNKPEHLNYVFICAGSDDLNRVILENFDKCFTTVLEASSMRVMVKHSAGKHAHKPESIKHIKACVHYFGGDQDIWKYKVISDSAFTFDAKEYYAAYKMASEGLNKRDAYDKWQEREIEIYSPNTESIIRKKRIRQRSQDFANCLHLTTKAHLIGEKFFLLASELAKSIPSTYQQPTACSVLSEPHCLNCPEPQELSKKMLTYLAVGEHIRWVASHIVMGYSWGPQDSDEEKTHTCIVDYDSIPDRPDNGVVNFGHVRHYDWIVIKTALEMAASKLLK